MEKLELKAKAKLIVNVEGKDYELKRPKIGAVMAMEEDMDVAEKNGGKGASRAAFNFVIACGLPEEVASGLDHEELVEVSEFIVGVKKNLTPPNSALPS